MDLWGGGGGGGGCHTPPPPPTPWYPPLPVKWVVVLFGLVAFPVWSCLASSPPLWSGTCGVFYRGMVWLLPLVSGNVIVTCLVPSPPVGWGLWSLWLAPPRLCGAVCSTEIWDWPPEPAMFVSAVAFEVLQQVATLTMASVCAAPSC